MYLWVVICQTGMNIVVIWRFSVKFSGQSVPEFEANFKNFCVFNFGNFNEVAEAI